MERKQSIRKFDLSHREMGNYEYGETFVMGGIDLDLDDRPQVKIPKKLRKAKDSALDEKTHLELVSKKTPTQR